MAYLYADYYQKRFKVSFCSIKALFWLAFLALAIGFPYYICWASQGI